MALGFLKIPYKSVVLSYDDEKTPIDLCGKKMLPIAQIGSETINESLDIIERLDSENKLKTKECLSEIDSLNFLLSKIGSFVHPLAMPHWMYTPEFDLKARKYFQNKKEASKGAFNLLYQRKEEFQKQGAEVLKDIEDSLESFYKSQVPTLNDILIASHLWGLYIVPEFQFSPKLHNYLQEIKKISNFDYQKESWL